MSTRTGIEWTEATWNPIRGCSLVSPGCQQCYAMEVAARFSGPGLPYEGLARRRSNGKAQWTGEVRFIEKHLYDPIRWQRPRRVFVNSMSDLFHEQLVIDDIAAVFAVMALARRHTFQVLTKRAEEAREVLSDPEFREIVNAHATEYAFELTDPHNRRTDDLRATAPDILGDDWPLSNVWLGVSVEDQKAADERIPKLLDTPAAVRFISAEPLLGPVALSQNWRDYLAGWDSDQRHVCGGDEERCRRRCPDIEQVQTASLDWVIVGGESGPGARSCDLAWIRNIVAQCSKAGVACFVKQMGSNPIDPLADTGWLIRGSGGPAIPEFHDRKGGNIEEWPADLRVREFPEVRA